MVQMAEQSVRAAGSGEGASASGQELTTLRLADAARVSRDVMRYVFESPVPAPLPAFTAGAHIDLHLPNGMMRQYSLLNPSWERHRYVIAVKRESQGRGGSVFMHENLKVGVQLKVGLPRNLFPLETSASDSVLVAGGIGLTPFLSMIAELQSLGRRWKLHYAARGPEQLDLLGEWADHPWVTKYVPGVTQALALPEVMDKTPADAHVYCCGPDSMVSEFERLCAERRPHTVHVERFAAARFDASRAFVVVLSRSGKRLKVEAGKTILETLREAGVEVSASCGQGICGACETAVLAGTPEHRDSLLTTQEQAAGRSMMICCSGSQTEELVLDL